MGYGVTTNAIYGVYLDPEQSEKLISSLAEFTQQSPDHFLAREARFGDRHEHGVDIYDVFDALSEETEMTFEMVAENSDSRIHHCNYEPGFFHAMGIVLAARGYGGDATTSEFSQAISKGPTDEQRQAFENLLRPWLKFAGLNIDPTIVVVSNTD